jgi:hypothetical protein
VRDSFIEPFVIVERTDFDDGAKNHLRAVLLKLGLKPGGLVLSARDDNRAPAERQVVIALYRSVAQCVRQAVTVEVRQ